MPIFLAAPGFPRRGYKILQDILAAAGLVAAMTVCLLAVTHFVELQHVSSAYLIPVLIAAIKLGILPAIAAAIGGVAASAFFFYPPIYDFRVTDPAQLLDLPMFVIVATVTGQLAARSRGHVMLADEREHKMRALYAFSRRLAVSTDASQIYAAIEEHLASITGRPVIYFDVDRKPTASKAVPPIVQKAVHDYPQGSHAGIWTDDIATGTRWLVRAVATDRAGFGFVAIDAGAAAGQSLQERIDAVLDDAAATLVRLDVARAIADVKVRSDAETLRVAIMGSASHGLRTPLASIMGSASVLMQSPVLAHQPQLAELPGIIRDEAERLNGDIQRLLDASSISSTGVRPHPGWSEVSDIVNSAIKSQGRALAKHDLVLSLTDDLPLVFVDPVLIDQALGQILDNAAKYAPAGSRIVVATGSIGSEIYIRVKDNGAGLKAEEQERVFERFYRGTGTREATSGSGLGLWIARAFIIACQGRLTLDSAGEGQGATVTMAFPASTREITGPDGLSDD